MEEFLKYIIDLAPIWVPTGICLVFKSILKADLQQYKSELEKELKIVQKDLDILKNKDIVCLHEKIKIYQSGIDFIAKTLSDFTKFDFRPNSLKLPTPEYMRELNTERLKLYGRIATIAPQSLIKAQDRLIDYLFEVVEGKIDYSWENEVRPRSLELLNEIRKDLGLNTEKISYFGER